MSFTLRSASDSDAAAILAIYNDAVASTTATFDTDPRSVTAHGEWMRKHAPYDAKFPLLVAESAGHVIGWASISQFSDRKAYEGTRELSLYVAANSRGHGVGRALFAAIIEAGRAAGARSLISRVTQGNDLSLTMHERAGFRHVGTLNRAGEKFGKLLDVHILQKEF